MARDAINAASTPLTYDHSVTAVQHVLSPKHSFTTSTEHIEDAVSMRPSLSSLDHSDLLDNSWFTEDDRAASVSGGHPHTSTLMSRRRFPPASYVTPAASIADNLSSLEHVEQSFRERGTSISFDTEATTDNGERLPLDYPLPRNSSICSQRPHTVAGVSDGSADQQSPDSSPLMLAQRPNSVPGAQPLPSPASTSNHRRILRPVIHPTSLTNASTISTSTSRDGTTTPCSLFDQSPTALSSPMFTSLPDAASLEPWTVFRQSSFKSARNFASSRQTSLRRMSRQSSKRSASSSFSPASAFLSKWTGDGGPSVPEPDAEGQSFGDSGEYIIGRQLGFGGFSVVKEVFTILPDRQKSRFAVKIVRKPVTATEDSSMNEEDPTQAQLEHEISIWRHLSHKHILALHTVFESDFATFCVMDYKDGGTLYELIVRGRKVGTKGLGPVAAKSYSWQLACALRYLHQDIRIVHRDVKLENCLIDTSADTGDADPGNLSLCDFGLSDFITLDSPVLDAEPSPTSSTAGMSDNGLASTSDNGIMGSLDYVAPESLRASRCLNKSDQQPLTPNVDIWALGVCIFAILTGERPFKHAISSQLVELILAGKWDHEIVRTCPTCTDSVHGARYTSRILELLRGCLDTNVTTRWNIGRVLESEWFTDCGDPL